jgi:L-fucose mutarotase/ribose pyranase (RbsD/FucU family)
MLKGISPLFSPELLVTIYRMGHGDEIVLADAHFPGQRFAFYERSKSAFAVVMTGDTRKYANIILKKGVTPVAA